MRFTTIFTATLLTIFAQVAAAQNGTPTPAGLNAYCVAQWSERGEVTDDVTLQGNPIRLTTKDGTPWGSEHDIVVMKFRNTEFQLDVTVVVAQREVSANEARPILADYIGTVESLTEEYGGSTMAVLTSDGVILGASFFHENERRCFSHQVIDFSAQTS